MLEIIIAIQTFLMGVYILFLDNSLYENFQIGKILDNKLWGAVLVISALLVVVTQLKFKESKRLKMTGLSLLQGIWSFYGMSTLFDTKFIRCEKKVSVLFASLNRMHFHDLAHQSPNAI